MLDNENNEEPDDIEREQESIQVTLSEAFAMNDRLVHTSGISTDYQNAFFGVKKNLERIIITKKSKKTYVIISNVLYRRDIIFMHRNVSY